MNKEMALTIAEVLKRPLFEHAAVEAGSRGLQRSIRWVHVLETAENASFLNGGELILSTGIGFGGDANKRLAYLQEIIKRNAAGLCIELGTYISEIPLDMIEAADHYDFPLIVFRTPVRFVDITLDLHENIINRQTQALRHLQRYATELQQLTLRTQSLPKTLAHFQEIVHNQTFFIAPDGPTFFVPSMPQSTQHELEEVLQSLLSTHNANQGFGVMPISDKKQVLYQPITAMGNVLAYLGVILYEQPLQEFLLLTLDYTSSAIAQILLRRMFIQERSFEHQHRLLEDILNGRDWNEEQLRSVLMVQPKPGKPISFWAAVAEVSLIKPRYSDETDSPFYDLLGIFRSILTRNGFRPLFYCKGNRLYVFLFSTEPPHLKRDSFQQVLTDVERTCRQVFGSEAKLRFGISNAYQDHTNVKDAFKEAERVLAFASEFSSPFFNDLGVYRLLLHNNSQELDSFIRDYLGPLINYDCKHQSQLVLTLQVYLECALSKKAAAERLYIRRQTLYHRLDKIKELLGENYSLPENRLCLELALRAHKWLQDRV